ncbi:MAG TPA: CBS domain-containing protein [Methanocorpusculum sp.]|nr:CBS domain-containing protein [Methanocorpusculum sp.]
MTKEVYTIDAAQTVKVVVALIRESHHDGFPVLSRGKVVGMISARDVVGAAASALVAPLMAPVVLKAQTKDAMADVARKMFRFCVDKLPVVDEAGLFVGIVTNADIIRSQIERVTPEKVFQYIATLRKLYGLDPHLSRGEVPVRELIPTQDKVYLDDLDGRTYEINKGLAEPLIVVRRKGKYLVVDGHHRAVAANRLHLASLDAYIIDVDSDEELGIEKTSRSMRLWSLDDVKILNESRHSFIE